MLNLNVKIEGQTVGDLVDALKRIAMQIKAGETTVSDGSDTCDYEFKLKIKLGGRK